MFPDGRPSSIFSAKKLNYCVRNGNRCDLLAITTEETFRFIIAGLNMKFISTEPVNIMKLYIYLRSVSSLPDLI